MAGRARNSLASVVVAITYRFASTQPAIAVAIEPVERIPGASPLAELDPVVPVRVQIIELFLSSAARPDGCRGARGRIVLDAGQRVVAVAVRLAERFARFFPFHERDPSVTVAVCLIEGSGRPGRV